MWLPCGLLANWLSPLSREFREPGGRGRIRTFVARKERQIYSLLVLATHPPVPVLVFQGLRIQIPKPGGTHIHVPKSFFNTVSRRNQRKHKTDSCLKTPARSILTSGIRSASLPCRTQRWSWRRELNPRPSDYKSDALPAELRQPRSNRVRIADWARNCKGLVEAPSTTVPRCGKCSRSFPGAD